MFKYQSFIGLIILILFSCETEDPQFSTRKIPRVKNIITSGYGYSLEDTLVSINDLKKYTRTLFVHYKNDKIDFITRRVLMEGRETLLDSTNFFYNNNILNSAIKRQLIWNGKHELFMDSLKFVFISNDDQRITSLTANSNLQPDIIKQFTYNNEGKISSIRDGFDLDTVYFNKSNGMMDTLSGYNKLYIVSGYSEAYNPYYLINKDLGYPFMSSCGMYYVFPVFNELTEFGITDFSIKHNRFSTNEYKYFYDYDSLGRIVSRTETQYSDVKIEVEYY